MKYAENKRREETMRFGMKDKEDKREYVYMIYGTKDEGGRGKKGKGDERWKLYEDKKDERGNGRAG